MIFDQYEDSDAIRYWLPDFYLAFKLFITCLGICGAWAWSWSGYRCVGNCNGYLDAGGRCRLVSC